MKKKILFLIIICIAIIYSCSKENPYASKSVIDSLVLKNKKQLLNIAVIYNNDVYLFPSQDSVPKKITNTPNIEKRKIRISHNHTKFAYINSNGNPVIIDSKGSVLATLTQYSNITSMDWSPNDLTLYMLIGNKLSYYGPTMNLPDFAVSNLPEVITLSKSNIIIKGVSVSMNNDMAYILSYYSNSVSSDYLIIKKNDGTIVEKSNDYLSVMTYINFSGNATDLVVGYSSYGETNLYSLEIYETLTELPTLSLYGSSIGNYPCYRSDVKYLVCANMESNNGYLFGASVKDTTTFKRSQYNGIKLPLYVDWK